MTSMRPTVTVVGGVRMGNLTYGSVCSGIESASVAWEPLGFTPRWFSEIEPFPSAVLRHHWPLVPNLGDMGYIAESIRHGFIDAPDILVGGTPCQAFSVAGKQGSLTDARGGLTLIYGDILNAIDEQRPGDECIAVWENVPGVLSTKDNAFGYFLGLLAGEYSLVDATQGRAVPLEAQPGASRQKWPKSGCVIGPKRTVAWRILDAQHFGVAQRRRRVFVVASARDGFDPAEVLFERDGLRRDTAPSREAGSPVAALTANGVGTCGADDNQAQAGHLCVTGNRTHCLTGEGFDASEDGTGRGTPITTGHRMLAFGEYATDETASTMKARDYKDATDLVTHAVSLRGRDGGATAELEPELNPTLRACSGGGDKPHVLTHAVSTPAVRRLTPVECERLQGFPDGHTDIPWRGKPCPDGHRYKAIGNSKAVPVVQWLGRRIRDAIQS